MFPTTDASTAARFAVRAGSSDLLLVSNTGHSQPTDQKRVQHGDAVTLTGTVPQSPEQLHGFGIKNPDKVQRISREKVYVLANEVHGK